MRKTRLTESELINLVSKIINEDTTSAGMGKLLDAAKGIDKTKRDGWVKLIKQCISEFDEEIPGFSRDMKIEGVLSGMMLLFILGAIVLDFDIAAVLGGVVEVMLADSQIKKWKKVIECAKNKKSGINNTMKESIMRKTTRLTESDLQRIVRRVIKEDEMMLNPCSQASLKNSTNLRNIFGNKLKNKTYGANISGSYPFCVANRDGGFAEMKRDIKLSPDTKIFSKNCNVEVYPLINGLASGKSLSFSFDSNGKASI